jgi:hypothetical protein
LGEIRVAVVSTRNLYSSLVQGMQFYFKAKKYLGLLHPDLDKYTPGAYMQTKIMSLTDSYQEFRKLTG